MNAIIRPVEANDWPRITAIFNHFITESFAAYNDQPVSDTFFSDRYTANPGYPFLAAVVQGEVVTKKVPGEFLIF